MLIKGKLIKFKGIPNLNEALLDFVGRKTSRRSLKVSKIKRHGKTPKIKVKNTFFCTLQPFFLQQITNKQNTHINK